MFLDNPIINCKTGITRLFDLDVYLITSLTLLVLFIILWIILVKRDILSIASLGILFIGGILNLYELYSTGCVKDYISFFGISYFNIPDFLVMVGFFSLLLMLWKKKN